MSTSAAQDAYKLRKQLVEPAFGIIKEQQGARRSLLGGLVNVAAEWTMLVTAFNLRTPADAVGRRVPGAAAERPGGPRRRFYAVCEFGRIDELRSLPARAGLSIHPLRGRQLRMFLLSAALGGSPAEFDEETPVEVEINRRDMRVAGILVRSLHLGKWPRSLAPGFLQSLMAAGAPMDLSVHLGPIPAEQAARTLEWEKVRFESAQSLSFKRGRTMSPEVEIALEDVTRLRDEVQRGCERLFHSSLSVTVHAKDEASLKEMTQRAKAHFGATLGKLDDLAFRQREGLLSTLPLALNAVAEWRSPDTSSIARLFPFSPPDLDTRSGTLYGIDLRACSPVVYDPWDGTPPERQHRRPRPVGFGKSFRHQARCAQRSDQGRHRLRHRPRGRVRGHGAGGGRARPLSRRARPGHEPLRHRQGRVYATHTGTRDITERMDDILTGTEDSKIIRY